MLKELFLTAIALVLATSFAAQDKSDYQRKGGNEMSRRLVHKVTPVYPPEAKAAGIEGTVRLEALINEKGEIVDLSVVWGPEELRNSALSAVSQWRYEALDVKVKTDIDINYVLAKDEKEKK
jgi:protein TonB